MASEQRPILRNEAGLTILATGVIKIRESKAVADSVLAGDDINDPERAKQVRVTLNHEIVHHYQALTTAFVFAHCLETLRLTELTALWLNDKNRDITKLAELKEALTDLENEMRVQTGYTEEDSDGVSALQLMEATAVVESLKALKPDLTLAEIFDEVSKNADDKGTYTRALNISDKAIGAEATVRLLPTLAFIALNIEQPGEVFCTMLRLLSARDPSRVVRSHPIDLINEFMADRTGSLISEYAMGRSPANSPFWKGVGLAFGASGDPDTLNCVAANPSSLLAESNWSKLLDEASFAKSMPSITMYEDGKGQVTGLVKDWSDDRITSILAVNEIIGVMYRLGLQRNYDVLCQLEECPDRSVALCHMAYPPAPHPQSNWKNCQFRLRFKDLTGDWPAEFARKCGIT